jgi:hypothetical protein
MKNKPSKPQSKMPFTIHATHKKEGALTFFILKMKWLLHRLFLKINHRFTQLGKITQWLLLLSFFMGMLIYLTILLTKALHLNFNPNNLT